MPVVGYLQWKALVALLLACERAALRTHMQLYVQFLRVLLAQLQMGLGAGPSAGGGNAASSPAPFGAPFVEELLPDSFLRHSFAGFFEMLRDAQGAVPPALGAAAEQLQGFLRGSQLGWEFRLHVLQEGADEYDEYAPVVVDLTPEQQAALQL